MILFDTNVIVAALVTTHPHHHASTAALLPADPGQTLVAAHSLAECYSVLTRRNLPFRMDGPSAWLQLQRLSQRFAVVALTAAEQIDAIRRFGALGSGPRVYDFLIGATAQAHGAGTLVTWNSRDFDGLFPALRIVTPEALV